MITFAGRDNLGFTTARTFVCDICGLAGTKTTPNQKHHQGECDREYKRRYDLRKYAKQKRRAAHVGS